MSYTTVSMLGTWFLVFLKTEHAFDSGPRRDTMTKDRERWHQDDEGNEHNSQHQRRQTDGRDFYASRDKDRAESPGASRYRDRDEWDWKYSPRHERDRDDSSSGGRYRDDRHYDHRKEYRGHDDSRRPRHKKKYIITIFIHCFS